MEYEVIKKLAGRGLAIVCIAGYAYVAVFGGYGLYNYLHKRRKLKFKQERIAHIEHEIAQIKHEFHAWNVSPLKREALARTDFGMGRVGELVYLVK